MRSEDAIDRRTWRLCWVIVLGAFASGLDTSIVHVGLTSIGADLRAPLTTTQWVASGYLLALAVSLPVAGWLGRRFGTGRTWLVALAAFTTASLICALAPTVEVLIGARVAQGLVGGVLIPTGQAILGQAVGPDRLGRVMGVLGIAVSAAPAVGPLLGGVLLHWVSWPWLFVINLPIGILGLALGWRIVPRGDRVRAEPLHLPGLALISLGLSLFVLVTTLWGEAGELRVGTIAVGVIAVTALVAFVFVSRGARHPILDLNLFRIRGFRAGALAALFSGALVFGSGVVCALYFQIGRGLDTLGTGVAMLGMAAATAVAAPFAGRWIDRFGSGPVAIGGGVLAIATTSAMLLLPLDAPGVLVQPVLILYGAAICLVAMPAGVSAYKSVSASQLPDAITQVNILQRLGGALGGAVCAVLIAAHQTVPESAFRIAFAALLVAAFGAFAGGLLIRRASRG